MFRISHFTFAVTPLLLVSLVHCGLAEEPSLAASGEDAGAANDQGRTSDGGSGVDASKDSATKADALARADVDAPACSPTTKAGDPCSVFDEWCSLGACNDPCQFCNSLRCNGTTFEQIEALPLPQGECKPTFPCGTSTCTHGQYCLVQYAGVTFADGGTVPPTRTCVALPPNCLGGCICANVAAQSLSVCQPGSCNGTSGGPVVSCYGI